MPGTTFVGVFTTAAEVHSELEGSAIALPIPAWSIGAVVMTVMLSLLLVTYSFKHVAARR